MSIKITIALKTELNLDTWRNTTKHVKSKTFKLPRLVTQQSQDELHHGQLRRTHLCMMVTLANVWISSSEKKNCTYYNESKHSDKKIAGHDANKCTYVFLWTWRSCYVLSSVSSYSRNHGSFAYFQLFFELTYFQLFNKAFYRVYVFLIVTWGRWTKKKAKH